MSIAELIKTKRFAPGKGVIEPPPQEGIKRFFFLLKTHFWMLVTLNILFLAFCIPIITIPAALCGMNRVLMKLVRDGNCFLWEEFWVEFKANLIKSIPYGVLFVFLLFDSYYFLSWSISTEGVMSLIMGATGIFILILTILLLSYVFVFLPTLALKNIYIAKNAFILMVTEWKTNLVILTSTLILAFFTIVLFPYIIFFFLLGVFSITQLIVCTAIGKPLQERIIGPFEQKQMKG